MARVDFYRLTRDPVERVLPAIATRILDGGSRLLDLPEPVGQAGLGGVGVEDDVGAGESVLAPPLGEVAVVADVGADLADRGVEDRVADVAGAEVELLPELREVRDVVLAVLAEVAAVGIDDAKFDVIAERVRKIGNTTLRSIGDVSRHQTLKDNDKDYVSAKDMLAELRDDNLKMVEDLRTLKDLADAAKDNATSAVVDEWTDAAERRAWFLFEAAQAG